MTADPERAGWRRLDLRMLLIHPVDELIKFLPLLIGVVVLGSSDVGSRWTYLWAALPVVIGLARFATTSFRITATQIELRRGLLSRSTLTAPLDRVRTVELTAEPMHRLLALQKVEIGTGSASTDAGRIVLDSLGAAEARRLRAELLNRARQDPARAPAGPDPTDHPAQVNEEVLLRLDPGWVRYAPLTTSGITIALLATGLSMPVVNSLVTAALDADDVLDDIDALPVAVVLVAIGVVSLVVFSALAAVGYLLANWNLGLTRDPAVRTYHLRRGLLTTRETILDIDRVRGVELHEPLGLRLAGGARLTVTVTGLGKDADGSAPVVPPAPHEVATAVGESVLAEGGPLHVELTQHGPAARRRRYVRALVPLTVTAAALSLVALVDGPVWVAPVALLLPVAGVALARDRYARLGHALTPAYVVSRWGSLRGRRDVLQRTGIIGWNLRRSFFQRRAGVVTLTATTAAGRQSYTILDVTEDAAIRFADEAVPGLVAQFLAEPTS